MTHHTETCGHCGTENPEGTDFCKHCGRPLTASAEEGLREHLEAEREPDAMRESQIGLGEFDFDLGSAAREAHLPPKD